jgi:hypothetical protein
MLAILLRFSIATELLVHNDCIVASQISHSEMVLFPKPINSSPLVGLRNGLPGKLHQQAHLLQVLLLSSVSLTSDLCSMQRIIHIFLLQLASNGNIFWRTIT